MITLHLIYNRSTNMNYFIYTLQATSPLIELLKVSAKFQWTPEFQMSFERFHEMLMNDTVMAYFDPRRKKRLKTNAGAGGMAATMKQYDPKAKRWRPVTYPSRALTYTKSR